MTIEKLKEDELLDRAFPKKTFWAVDNLFILFFYRHE